ncbi:MAG: helix-turn-helix transcriptional regulator, partial [Coprobacillus sp.]
MNQQKIGKFIAESRKNKNMTQEELAQHLNVSNKSVSRWETGKNMPDYS